MIKISNVLVATDFSDASESALLYGREFARTFGATLHVLHVVENPVIWAGPEAVGIDYARLQADLEAGAQNTLNRIVTAEDREQLFAEAVHLWAEGYNWWQIRILSRPDVTGWLSEGGPQGYWITSPDMGPTRPR